MPKSMTIATHFLKYTHFDFLDRKDFITLIDGVASLEVQGNGMLKFEQSITTTSKAAA